MAEGDVDLMDKYMLFAGLEVRIVKNSDQGLDNAARGHGSRVKRATVQRQATNNSHI